ncbi:MAG: N-acetylmuramoyl-L-alanine amidase-like domain-containing protein [Verrucomicrobiales bacterium]
MFPDSSSLPFSRRQFLNGLGGVGAGLFLSNCKTIPSETSSVTLGKPRLPWPVVFKGEAKFHRLCEEAGKKNWAALPLAQRTVTVGKAITGTPYGNYTLEIDDKIESPSVNFETLDCWTFYETSLAFSRMVKNSPSLWSRESLLHYIELERYREGRCNGNYLSRMHHLEEVFADNEKRGLGQNVTRSLGGVPVRRNVREMQAAWKQYRYLKSDPSLIPGIAQVEARVSALPVTYIPRSKVAGIESKLQDGDVLAVATQDSGGYTSHVGLALRDGATCRFMHATSSRSKGKCCVVDTRISQYLREKSSNMGLIVFRPAEAPVVG